MARRVNTKFLTILTCVVLGLAVTGVLAKKFLIRESPDKYVNAGNQLLSEKKYEEAAKNFAHAVALEPKDPDLWVQYGDALNQLSPQDPEYLMRARQAWESALAVNPAHRAALDRVMQFWTDWADLNPSQPKIFEGMKDTAERLLAADPKNAEAEVALVTSEIRPWLAGVEKDQRLIEDKLAQLVALMKKYPQNADLPKLAAQAKLRLAERRRAQDQDPQSKPAQALVAEANKIVEEAVARTPSAAMFFSAAQIYHAQEATDPRNTTVWRQKKRDMYKKASEVAQVDDPLYVQIHVNAARAAAGADDRAGAEQILRNLFEKMPHDQHVRIALAEHLAADTSKRGEAMAILEKPFADSGLRGPKAMMLRDLQVTTLVMLTNLRLEQYGHANEEQRKRLIEPIRDGIAKIEAKDGVNLRSLRLKGKLLRMQGEIVEAIQTLEKARQMADQRYGNTDYSARERWEVIDMLAKAYLETNQTGAAKKLLKGLVDGFPDYDPARMLLAQILIREGSYNDARAHVDYFKRKNPSSPEVMKLELQLMDPKTALRDPSKTDDREKIKAVFARLPETSKPQILDKANAAMVIDSPDEAVRLLNKAQQENPGDFDVAAMAVRIYRATGELDNARAAVAAALQANPNNEKLKLLSRQLADLTPEGLLKVQEEEVAKNPDDFARHMGMANIARRRNQPDEALKHLLAAVQVKPENADANSLLFNHYLSQKQWDKAEAMLESVTRLNLDQSNGVLYRYRLAMAKGDHATALGHARTLTQRMGEFGQSWIALAQVQQAMGQFDEALKNYNEALQKQSDSPDALRGAIESYYAVNQPNLARDRIRYARRAMPSNAYFQELEINHELTFGDPANAIAPREEQVRRNPDNMRAVMALGQAYLATARSYIGKEEKAQQSDALFAKAREQFRAGLTKWPDEIAFYMYYAETAARSGNLGDSEQVLKQLAARDQWKDRVEPQMLLAEYYGITKRYPEAEKELRGILAKDPKNAETQVRLANLLVNQNKVEDALKALEANAANPRVARRKVEILLGTGRLDEAENALEHILAQNPGNLEMLQLAASVQIDRAKFTEAEQKLNRALEIDAQNPTTHYFVGLLKMNQPKADIPKAMEHLAKAKNSPSMGTDARFALADGLRRQGNVDGAIRELESALQSQPNNKRVRLALIDEYLALQPPRTVDAERAISEGKRLPGMADDLDLMQREVSILANREPKKAVDLIKKVLAANPNDESVVRKSLELLLKSRSYNDVNARVAEVVAKNPDAWWAYQARAVATRYLGRREDALKDFEAALEAATRLKDDAAAGEIIRTMGDVIGPDEAIARIRGRAEQPGGEKWQIMIARLQQARGDTQAAIKTLETVLAREDQLQPADKVNAYRFGGTLYLMVGDAPKSVDSYRKLLELAPEDMTALNNLAVLLADVVQPSDPKEGLKYSQRAYELMQKSGRRDPLVLDTHGWLLTLAGQLDQGIDVLRSSLQLKRIPDAHYHLGEAYLKKNFADQALSELELAMDLFKRMREEKQPVDPSLEGKIENALTRANISVRQKKPGAAPAAAARVQ